MFPDPNAAAPQDWQDPYALPPRPLSPGVPPAGFPGSSQFGGFQPGQDNYSGADWWRNPLDPSAFSPQLTASGSAGMGNTAQPEANTGGAGPSAAAGQLLGGGKQPPPPVPAGLASAPAPQPQGPPSLPAAMPPPGHQAAPAEAQPPSATQQAIDRDTALLSQPAPSPGGHWYQRLGMAMLAATKLAPYAQQIVHPVWSEQMAAREAAGKELGELSTAQETQQRGAYYQQQADESKGRYIKVGTGVFDQQEGKWAEQPMDKSNLVAIDPSVAKERGLAPLADGTYMVPATVAAQFVKPGKDPGGMYVTKEVGERLGIQPENGQYYLPPQGIGPHVTSTEKPPTSPTAESQKIAYQNVLAKLHAAGQLPVNAATDSTALLKAINKSQALTQPEKDAAASFLAANPTPSTAGTQAQIRVEGMQGARENPVINKQTGELELRDSAWVNSHPGMYMPAGQGATAMGKEAVFQDLHYNIQTARNAINALDSLDTPTRAALSFALRDTDPRSAMQTFLGGALGTTLTPQQQEAVQAIALLNENAMALRGVSGMGQGSDELRGAIRATLPGGKSPSKGYALGQLQKFESVVNRLEKGVPGTGRAQQQTGARPSLDDIFKK